MLNAAPATTFQRLRVVDVMHPGTIACQSDTPLRSVARMMASYRVHAIVVLAHGGDTLPGGAVSGVISDVKLLEAAEREDFDRLTAGELACDPVLEVTGGEDLDSAVRLMIEHESSHVVVVEPAIGRPIGVLSTLDVARMLAGFDSRPAPLRG